MLDEEMLKQLETADIERAKAYANDLERGLKIVRTFPKASRSLVRLGCRKTINIARKRESLVSYSSRMVTL